VKLETWDYDSRPIFSVGSISDPITNKIFSFQRLPRGWHYGRGRGASSIVASIALAVVAELRSLGVEKFEAFPEVEGEILVSGYRDDVCIDVTVQLTGMLTYVISKNNVEIAESKKPIAVWELSAKMGAGNWLPENLFASSILSTTVKNYPASNPLPSRTRTEVAYRWSMNAA